LQELLAGKYAGKVRLYYRHFPLPQHPRAMVAAQAAEYAREKGKFWELAELMFKNQEQLEDENLGKLARQAGLDPAAMLAAVADGTYSTHVIADRTHGEALGIRGTPTLFINGRPFFLRPSRENIERTLDDELDWIQNGGQWSAD
jgi:protein-disulfide isomerase